MYLDVLSKKLVQCMRGFQQKYPNSSWSIKNMAAMGNYCLLKLKKKMSTPETTTPNDLLVGTNTLCQ